MLALVISVLALQAAQPSTEEGEVKPPPGAKPTAAAPAAEAAAKQLTFEPKTMVDGESLQVVYGQRATFGVDGKGRPVIEKVEEGQLAVAHPDGKVTEKFEAPPSGSLAAALDGSMEKKASFLKVWNGTGDAIEYRGMGLVLLKDNRVRPVPLNGCPIAPGAVRVESFPAPIVAVSLARFRPASKEALARPGCK